MSKTPAVDPYFEDLIALFRTYGPEVRSEDVPELVRSGVTVFSFGYGDDDATEEGFDAIEESDLWAWGDDGEADVVASWAPFRLDPDVSDKVKKAYAAYVAATSN